MGAQQLVMNVVVSIVEGISVWNVTKNYSKRDNDETKTIR